MTVWFFVSGEYLISVSYTHLDVYKRQGVPYSFNLEKWLANTKFGGGFVRVMGTERELK